MLFKQNGYTPPDSPAGVPLIGYQNVVVNYGATEAAAGHPASNMGNPATSSTWQSTTAAAQRITLTMNNQAVGYVGIARHSLLDTSSQISLSYTDNADAAAGTLVSLLHFDAADATSYIMDSSGNDEGWIVNGNAQIDTAQSKFGGSSLLTLGVTGDYIISYGGNFAFGTANFTLDFWVRFNSLAAATQCFIDTRAATSSVAVCLVVETDSNSPDKKIIRYFSNNGYRITGTTALVTNTWYHVALCRSGTSTKLFLNGVQEGGTYSDNTNYSLANAGNAYVAGSAIIGVGLNGWMDEFRFVSGTGYFTGTFTPPAAAYPDGLRRIFPDFSSLLHFDGANGSTTFTDSGGEGHVWTAGAFTNSKIDNAQSKFGGTSLLLTGSDYIFGDGSDAFAFGVGDFTVEMWIRPTSSAFGYMLTNYPVGFYFWIYSGDSHMYFSGPAGHLISGTTAVSLNTWHHVAVSRVSGSTRMFLDGIQESTTAADSTNWQTAPGFPQINLAAWVDEVKIIKGTGLYTHNFIVPQAPSHSLSPGGKKSVSDTLPIVFRFPTINPGYVVLSLTAAFTGALVHTIGVVYAGTPLVLERGVKVDVQHRVLNYARKTSVVSGMSENGQFLGRIVLAKWRESKADFAWFTPSWYRTNFEPFVSSATQNPFFWVWNPAEYPAETSFAWLSDDVVPDTDPATRRMAATISMRAIQS